jgi:hypothetical protein
MTEENYWIGVFVNPLRKLGRILGIAAMAAGLPVFLLYIFGFSIKSSSEYGCVMRILEENRQVLSITGSPIQPGLFAWIKYYERGGMISQGTFFTYISGPRGSGTVDVGFYHAPIGSSLGIWFTSKGEEIEVFDGEYPCDE